MEKEKIARLALKNALTTGVFKQNVLLFIEHHLDEVEPGYWKNHFGTTQPTALQVVDKLVLQDNSDANLLDFTLPDDVTQYLLCVTLEGNQIIDISMES